MQKHINEVLQNHFLKTGQAGKAKRVKECSSALAYKVWRDENKTAKLHSINLCRERLCANCATALARAKFAEVKNAFDGVDGVWFITLTTDNVKESVLRDTLSKMQKALKALNRKIENTYYFRTFEVTYNEKENTYHPHIHMLSKFEKKPSNKYIREEWAKCLHKAGVKTKYAWVSVHIEKASGDNAYAELCKYVTKPADITEETAKVLEPAVKGLQLKRGSKEVTQKMKEHKTEQKREKEQKEKELDIFGWDIEQYLWNNANYERV